MGEVFKLSLNRVFSKQCKMNGCLRLRIVPAMVVLAIFIVTCLVHSDDVPVLPQGIPWDKAAHFGMFFVLSGVCLFDDYRLHKGKPDLKRWMVWGWVLPVVYGAGIELMQKYFFPTRSAEWGDFIADSLGSATAWMIALFLYKKFRKPEKKLSL